MLRPPSTAIVRLEKANLGVGVMEGICAGVVNDETGRILITPIRQVETDGDGDGEWTRQLPVGARMGIELREWANA